MLAVAKKLRAAGVLGLNERNAEFIMRLNPRRLYPRVDDKALTKELAMAADMAVPDLYGIIANQGEVRSFGAIVKDLDSFVIKPAQGSGGDGILVITGRSQRKRDCFRLSSGVIISEGEILYHLSNIVGGQYSLSGNPDKALIEYCVHFDPVFAEVSYQGVPDIRVIVYRGYPAMAMVRLPTRASDGKANLHQGAVGVGIDVATGRTLRGVLDNDFVDEHPDTGTSFSGLDVPGWETILMMAARCYELTGLGYLGVDIVLDADRGPLMLELNARPGLNIQIANSEGIMHRLQEVQALADPELTAEERIAISVGRFGCPQVAVS